MAPQTQGFRLEVHNVVAESCVGDLRRRPDAVRLYADDLRGDQTQNFKPHDKEMLAKVSYAKVAVPEPFRRAIVDYHRKEAPGSIVVDSDNHYLYLRAARRQGDPLRHHRR